MSHDSAAFEADPTLQPVPRREYVSGIPELHPRLAEQLGHRESASVHDERAHATAAGMLYARREGSSPVAAAPIRIGDSYRRPAVTRDGRRA